MGSLWVSLVLGVVGGNLTALILKRFNLGLFWNSITGVVGGALGKFGLSLIPLSQNAGMAAETVGCILGAVGLVILAGAILDELAG